MATPINNKKNQANNGIVPLTDVLFKTLSYWPWLLLSVLVCVGIGLLKVARTPSVYTRSAALLIKEEGKGKSTSAGIDQFGEFGLFSNNTNIQNEMMTFKSPDLMEEVVKRLNLDYNYYLPGRFHKIVAYGTTLPVTVSMPDLPENNGIQFSLEVSGQGKVAISDFRLLSDKKEKFDYQGTLEDTIPTIAGPLIVRPTIYFDRDRNVELEVQKIPFSAAVGSYGARLGVSQDNAQGSVINLTFSDQDIQRADAVLNTVIGVYNENWIRDRNQIAVSTSNFINERLAVIENELGNVDSDISSFKSANLVPDVGAAAAAYFGESQALGQDIMALNNQIQMTRYVRSYLSSEGVGDKPLPTNTGMENLNIQSQISDYNAKLLERNNLLAKSSEKNPLVQRMDKELSEMQGAILASVDNYMINLQTQMKGLQGMRGAATSKLASSPTQEKYLLSVERQQKVKEDLYLFLLQKREDNELSQAFSAYNSRVIKKPGASPIPPVPNKKMIVAVCFLIGLGFPFAIVYAGEIMNSKVRGRKDVEALAIPMLGEIPQVGKAGTSSRFGKILKAVRSGKNKKKEETKYEIVVKPGSRNIINEAFRVLRTNIEFSRINQEGCNVLAVTSFNPGSGKSFITVNLGDAIALKDKKVVIIDGDMRHGSASAYVGRPEKGLADYLAGNISDLSSLLVPLTPQSDRSGSLPSSEKTAYILPVGSVPPNPTELLESPRFKQLIETLKPEFDYIIIDCPPIEVVADAQIIDQFADRTIFVIRAGLLERSMLSELDRLYEQKKFSHAAFILNGTMASEGKYGYAHTYKYGYGYGYGYGYNYGS
ncbi:MAG: polysaccharide biosynthesis tyrosine autokinase [Muribaculaceae bacterium]|nr:polysaccharide biosynthesis tyrosine autokinase [Muribaculaceae bacterium]